jgi:hypothetical protein
MQHNTEIEKAVDEEVTNIIENFDIKKYVRQELNSILSTTLKDSLKDAVHKALWSKEIQSILQTDVTIALERVLREYYPHTNPEDRE